VYVWAEDKAQKILLESSVRERAASKPGMGGLKILRSGLACTITREYKNHQLLIMEPLLSAHSM